MTWKREHDEQHEWFAVKLGFTALFAVVIVLMVIDSWQKTGEPPMPKPPSMSRDAERLPARCPTCGREF